MLLGRVPPAIPNWAPWKYNSVMYRRPELSFEHVTPCEAPDESNRHAQGSLYALWHFVHATPFIEE
jgi:hypothetical protein